jgi:hypothetical protein
VLCSSGAQASSRPAGPRAGVPDARSVRVGVAVAGPSVARSLDEAEHRCTLADVMAESPDVITGECAPELPCDPRWIAAVYARVKQPRERDGGHAHNSEGSRHCNGGVSNPPGRARGGSRAKRGGLLTPPLHQ